MPILRNAGGGSTKFITEPGDYVVEIIEAQMGKSKKGDPMVTIGFQTEDERKIKSFFVKKYPFMVAALNTLKAACGVKPESSSDELVGKKCGILVEKGKINDKGQAFPQITGYGLASEVNAAHTPTGYQAVDETQAAVDEIPF